MSFVKLDTDETMVLVLRRHWIVLAQEVVVSVILAAFVVPLWIFLPLAVPGFLVAPYRQIALTGTALYILFVWMGFFLHWVDYYLDVWIITDKRVIDVEQKGLFSREASEFRVERIQDVTTEIHGILPTFMDFGDVHVQTAGEGRQFIFKQVPYPEKAKELLLRERDISTRRQNQKL